MRLSLLPPAALAAVLALALPAAAAAAPPNDVPSGAEPFAPFTAANGRPREQQAVAELAEATADLEAPPCLGPTSFARTVWYRVPAAPVPQQLTVEAAGRTLDVVDLAAFVQPEEPPAAPGAPPPPPAPPVTSEPNACSGVGAGAGDEAEEPTSGVALRVPANHPVLLQVGRRGAAGSADDERAVLSLDVEQLLAGSGPAGDRADDFAPVARRTGITFVALFGATLTGEDPVQPPCPSLGTVWRKVMPARKGRLLIRASGPDAVTLTAFAGRRPTGDNAADCVNRRGAGALEMVVPVARRRPVWVRIGTDAPLEGAEATLEVADGERATVIDGGPGGFDPTAGGPGGGFPDACATARVERARIGGAPLSGPAGALNRFTRVPIAIRVRGASVCDAEIRLRGPRNRIYAKGRAIRLRGRTVVRLPRLETFRRGRYRLTVTAVSATGRRVDVRTTVRGRLR